jgi:hypothetical protein
MTAIHVTTEEDSRERLRSLWVQNVEVPARAAAAPAPTLTVIQSPYRRLFAPLLQFVDRTRKANPGRMVAVAIPELVEPHWYEYLLHNLHAAGLRAFS